MSTLKNQVGSFLYSDYKLGSFYALAKSLDSIEEYGRALGSLRLPESSYCSMTRLILNGSSIPASCSGAPVRIFKKIQEELKTYYPKLFPESACIVLKSSDLLSFSISPTEDYLIISIEWQNVDMKTSATLIDKLCAMSGYQLCAFIFTNGIYYTSLSFTKHSWVIHDSSGPSQDLRLEDALRFMVLRNMYPLMAFYKKSTHNSCAKTLIYNIAKQVDELLKFNTISIETPSDFWICGHCNSPVSDGLYECSNCAMINWPKFYEIKSKKFLHNNTVKESTSKPYRSPLINNLYSGTRTPSFSIEKETSTARLSLLSNRNSLGNYKKPTCELIRSELRNETNTEELSPGISNRLRIPSKEMALNFSPTKSNISIRHTDRSDTKTFMERRQKRDFTFGNK